MAVNSNGSNNRVAGRDFHEKNIQIERYDGSHTVNIAIPSNNDDDDRPLLKAQRKELNSLVAAIAEASNTEAFIIWQKVHAEIGVAGIDDMTVNQYKTAESFLHAMLERCKDHDACKALVSLLLRNSEDCGLRQKTSAVLPYQFRYRTFKRSYSFSVTVCIVVVRATIGIKPHREFDLTRSPTSCFRINPTLSKRNNILYLRRGFGRRCHF